MLDIVNACWYEKAIPHDWALASISLIFKKGDPASCENYRPISLQSTANKLLSLMLRERILAADADKALWPSQFGFRVGRGTEEAIYIARRRIETAQAQRFGKITLLALDWKKAVDSVHLDSLLDALRRFGLPEPVVDMINGTLRERQFYMEDCNQRSTTRRQKSGISQGCTLSPLLFVIVMSVMLTDAVSMLGEAAKTAYEKGDLADLLYADDTLLMGIGAGHLQEFLEAIVTTGAVYGMELHFGKFQLLSVGGTSEITTPDGTSIPPNTEMDYLGGILCAESGAGRELNRRIGIAKRDFHALETIWRHASISKSRKLDIYKAVIESGLLYGLASTCLLKAELRRLDGFQNRCLRRIIGVKPAYMSRVPNALVLKQSEQIAASEVLADRQMKLFKRILKTPEGHPLRTASFIPGSDRPAVQRYVRRVGRPAKEWIPKMLAEYRSCRN